MSYLDLYETRLMLEDVMRLVEAANYNAYVDKETGELLLSRKEFDEVCSIDPTPAKIYAKWLLTQYFKAKKTGEAEGMDPEEVYRRFIEDGQARIGPALSVFNDLKRNPEKAKEEGINLDIGGYDISKLQDLAIKYEDKKDQFVSKSAAEKDIVPIYEDEHWKILSPKTHLAARKYGTGTSWCTAVDNPYHYDHYTKQGPLIIIIDKTKPAVTPNSRSDMKGGMASHRWQIHLSSDQFKDASDSEVQDRMAILNMLPSAARTALSKVGLNPETYELLAMFGYRNRDNIDGERVKQLLAAGGDPHVHGEAVLKWAIKTHEDAIADQLIRDLRTERSVLADLVAEAAAASNFLFVRKIVDAVGPEAINANGAKALVKACQYPIASEDNRVYEKAKKAIKANGERPQQSRLPPREAIEAALGKAETTQYDALTEKVKVFYEQAFPIIQYFVEKGADVNAQNGEVLGSVCQWSNDGVLQIIEYLIQHGANVNANHSLAYWRAYNNFRPKVLKLLMSHGGKAA